MTFAWWGYAERKLWSRVRQEVNLLVQYTRTSSVFSECRNYMGAGVTWIYVPGGQKRMRRACSCLPLSSNRVMKLPEK